MPVFPGLVAELGVTVLVGLDGFVRQLPLKVLHVPRLCEQPPVELLQAISALEQRPSEALQ